MGIEGSDGPAAVRGCIRRSPGGPLTPVALGSGRGLPVIGCGAAGKGPSYLTCTPAWACTVTDLS